MGLVAAILFHSLFLFTLSVAWELHPLVRREDVVPAVSWKSSSCYKRNQVCCYRYKKCGHRCRTGYCSEMTMCTHTKFGKCFRWRSVESCDIRCFDKLCVRFECVPLKLVKGNSYVHPRIHTQVYYPDGKDPPPKPTPSRRPRHRIPTQKRKARPSRSPKPSRSSRPKRKPRYTHFPELPAPPSFPGIPKIPAAMEVDSEPSEEIDSSGLKFLPIENPLQTLQRQRQQRQQNENE